MSLENIIKSLENGICPAELLYNGSVGMETIDWDKVAYNLKYHTHEYYEAKFPNEIHKLPAFDKIIELVLEKNADNSPLKEINSKLYKDGNEEISITPSNPPTDNHN